MCFFFILPSWYHRVPPSAFLCVSGSHPFSQLLKVSHSYLAFAFRKEGAPPASAGGWRPGQPRGARGRGYGGKGGGKGGGRGGGKGRQQYREEEIRVLDSAGAGVKEEAAPRGGSEYDPRAAERGREVKSFRREEEDELFS